MRDSQNGEHKNLGKREEVRQRHREKRREADIDWRKAGMELTSHLPALLCLPLYAEEVGEQKIIFCILLSR